MDPDPFAEEAIMADHIEPIHVAGHDPAMNMPYVPAISVRSGRLVFVSGVTAAPIYHHHPHRPEDFANIPDDPGEQARLAMEELKRTLEAAGGTLRDVVAATRYIQDVGENQDAINRVVGEYFGDHRPTSTTVEVVRVATDPKLKFELSVVAVVPE